MVVVAGAVSFGGAGQPGSSRTEQEIAEGERHAQTICASCHRVPAPDVLPRTMWGDNIARMFLLSLDKPAPVIGPPGSIAKAVKMRPDWDAIVRYYEARAPQQLPPADAWPEPDTKIVFRRHTLNPTRGPGQPFISNVRLANLDGDARPELLVTDMRHGLVLKGRPYDRSAGLTEVATLWNPAHVEPADLDGDGVLDLLVGDLGTFLPSDEERGSVVWLRGRSDGTYQQMTLDGWPRVADVQAADFDGDGRRDLAVAAFGWRKVGHFTVLRNGRSDDGQPSFTPQRIDTRTGAIHVPVVDLNADQRPDIVALFSQEHETVVAFINTGPGIAFEPHTIYTAPHPNWGSSGIQPIDFDGDGDLDVVMTNGDTLDDAVIKPYHGIQWLENRGSYPFTPHEVARMAGVHRAQAADMDADGDLDIVACALVPAEDEKTRTLPALVWLERRRNGFVRHTLKRGQPLHATLDLGDIDGDGDADIVLGHMPSNRPESVWVEIWENQAKGGTR